MAPSPSRRRLFCPWLFNRPHHLLPQKPKSMDNDGANSWNLEQRPFTLRSPCTDVQKVNEKTIFQSRRLGRNSRLNVTTFRNEVVCQRRSPVIRFRGVNVCWMLPLLASMWLGGVVSAGASLPSSLGRGLDLSELEKKSLFQTLMPSRCSVNCVSTKLRPVCGNDDVTYSSRCELKRAKKCEKKRMLQVKHKGRCRTEPGSSGQCQQDLQDALRIAQKQNPSVLIPKCNSDGTYKEVQCHKSTGYCWCVTRDGRHIPGSSRKGNKKLRCKAVKRHNSRVTRKVKTKRGCSNRDRQAFNANLIKNFKDEYDRAVSKPKESDENGDEIGTEKAIVMWKYNELDVNKDGRLKFKEIRKFGRMVRKLIEPRKCGKAFLKYCDSKKDRSIDQKEWTLCLGVDIKTSVKEPSSSSSKVDSPRDDMLLHTSSMLKGPNRPVLNSRPVADSRAPRTDKKDESRTCHEQRAAAMLDHAQHPDAKHYIPTCTAQGAWERAQCHTGLCWCVQESDGQSIPWTATAGSVPNCTFDNERDMRGCPFLQKRQFLVDLMGDLTKERAKALKTSNGTRPADHDSQLPLREKVARWKLKSLDKNRNGMLERKEWRPLRRVTLKNKRYPRKCRRSFLRYCDADNSKKISSEEWIDCLGLSNSYSGDLPMSPKRKGKNPFMDQLRPSESR